MNADIAAQHAFDRLDRAGFEALNEMDKTLATVWQFDASVSNGCLEDYFGSKGGNLAFYAPQAFRTIGATGLAEIATQANRLFGPEGPAKDRKARQEQVRAFNDQIHQELKILDQKYYESEEDVDKLLDLYVNQTQR